MSLSNYIYRTSGFTGRWLLTKILRVSDHMAFFWLCLRAMIQYRRIGRRLIRRVAMDQIYFTGVQALELITVLALLAGAITVIQGINQLSVLGNLEGLSVLLIASIIREIGPVVTAIIISLRSGSAITLEMGYMNVLGETEGLEMQGISALHFMFTPRLIGVTVSMVCLIILFDMIAVVGGLFAAWVVLDTSSWNYFNDLAATLKETDFVVVVFKGLCFGIIIPVVCLYNGFHVEGAVTAIPPRLSRALVDCLLYIAFLNIIISVVFSFL